MAEKQGTSLASIVGFPSEAITTLADYWVTTAEELIGIAQENGGEGRLSALLGLDRAAIEGLVTLAMEALPPGVAFDAGIPLAVGMGALPVEGMASPEAEPVSFASLPEEIDLRARLPAVRNQKERSTCVAFACAAVRESLLGEEGEDGDLSEQYLYWACKEQDGHAGTGTYIYVGMKILLNQGVCPESVWSYNPQVIEDDEGQGPPPAGATEMAAPYRVVKTQKLEPRWKDTLREYLADGNLIAFSVSIYPYWNSGYIKRTGDIRLPLPGEPKPGAHAMCMVGYVDDIETPGGGYFLIRNSWGTDWAEESENAPGFGRLPYAYMQQYGWEAYTALMT